MKMKYFYFMAKKTQKTKPPCGFLLIQYEKDLQKPSCTEAQQLIKPDGICITVITAHSWKLL